MGQVKSFPIIALLHTKGFKTAEIGLELFKSWPKEWRQDQRLMLIIYAIMLFMPGRAARDDVVRDTQDRYYKMMLHYLIFLYHNTREAEIAFTALNKLMNQLKELGNVSREELKKNCIDNVEFMKHIVESSILKEILNLKI